MIEKIKKATREIMTLVMIMMIMSSCSTTGGDGGSKTINNNYTGPTTITGVTITSPTNLQWIDSAQNFNIEVRVDNMACDVTVEVFIDNVSNGQMFLQDPNSNVWIMNVVNNLPNGDHTIRVVATDCNGKSWEDGITITVIEAGTSYIQISAPLDGAEIKESTSFPITVDIHNIDCISKYEVLIDGVSIGTATAAPWTINMNAHLAIGNHTIKVLVIDCTGKTYTDSITIKIVTNTTPTAHTARVKIKYLNTNVIQYWTLNGNLSNKSSGLADRWVEIANSTNAINKFEIDETFNVTEIALVEGQPYTSYDDLGNVKDLSLLYADKTCGGTGLYALFQIAFLKGTYIPCPGHTKDTCIIADVPYQDGRGPQFIHDGIGVIIAYVEVYFDGILVKATIVVVDNAQFGGDFKVCLPIPWYDIVTLPEPVTGINRQYGVLK